MSDITLINISIAQNCGQKVLYRHNSVGMFLLIAVLEQAGFKVNAKEHFLDYGSSLSQELERFFPLIDTSSPIIGIGCHSVHLPFVVMACRQIKGRLSNKKIILGGIGPSAVAKDLLEAFNFIDAIVVGEGEDTLLELVKKQMQDLQDIKSLVYRRNNTVYMNEPRMPIEDLDKIPLPAYHALDFKQYQVIDVITSRGCLYACPFCGLNALWGRRVRFRSIDNIINELKLLVHKYGVKYILFGDASFIVKRDRTLEFCQRLKEENLGVSWDCLIRFDSVDEELMSAMSDSGCKSICYGLESGSDKVLKRIKQALTIEKSLDVIKKSIKYFKIVNVGLMWGFPFEDFDDFRQTLRIKDYLEKDFGCQIQLRWLEPYPATALYNEYKDLLFLPERLSSMYNPEAANVGLLKGKDFYRDGGEAYGIPADVTNTRFIIAASQTAAMCREIIEQNSHIFCDYYRYKTPDLEEKLYLVQRYSLY